MLTVKTDKEGTLLSVCVAVGQSGWNFPANHPTVVWNEGKDNAKDMYTIPIVYHDLESSDGSKTLDAVIDEYVALGYGVNAAEDRRAAVRDAMTAGLRLLAGENAKEPYRVRKGRSGAVAIAALKWLLNPARRASMVEYQTIEDEDKAAAWLLDKYTNRSV